MRFSSGNTLPLVSVPFGMHAYSLQTLGKGGGWFYHPSHRQCEGIRLTHQPSPWVRDYGHIVMMPQSGNPFFAEDSRSSGFDGVEILPHCMTVYFRRYHARFSLVPTPRCAIMEVCWDTDKTPRFTLLPFDFETKFEMDAEKGILTGWTNAWGDGTRRDFKLYFELRFDRPVKESETNLLPGQGISVAFDLAPGKKLTVKLGTSYLSPELASRSIDREIRDQSFEQVKIQAKERWNELLSAVEIEDTEEKKRTLYSCLYRCFLFPHVFHEIDEKGQPIHLVPETGKVAPGVMYTDQGFWDGYRTLYPLFSLLIPDQLREILQGFLNVYRDTGWLPKWLSPGERGIMPGTLIDAVLADAAVKGLLNREQMEAALEGMLKNAREASGSHLHGREGIDAYMHLGYVPCDSYRESANNTLDGAYCDFCVSQVAAALGRKQVQQEYLDRSKNYRNLFEPATGFLRGRMENGAFPAAFSPIRWGGEYCEGAAWQNGFNVPHDLEGLSELYGGAQGLIRKLDELFDTPPDYEIGTYPGEIHEMTEMSAASFGQCAISNEPSFHLPWLYAALGQRDKTAAWVHRIMQEAFSADAYPGDEDNGAMAAWYVLGVLGFYPLCPGKAEYVTGIPFAKQVILHLGNKKTIMLHPENAAKLPAFIAHSQLMRGDKEALE